MTVDHLLCFCGHRKFRHYHSTEMCDGDGDTCSCREFRVALSVTGPQAQALDPIDNSKDLCVMPDSTKDTSEKTKVKNPIVKNLEQEIEAVQPMKRPDEPKLESGLKDSGERLQYKSGMVRDIETNKPGFHLMVPKDIPFDKQMLTRVAEHLRKGAKKYSPRNWEKGNSYEEAERARESALRHMMQWIMGETDEDHAAATIINVIFAETMQYKADQKNGE